MLSRPTTSAAAERSPRGGQGLVQEGQPEGEDARQGSPPWPPRPTRKVKARGHQFDERVTLPVVVEDGVEELKTTCEVLKALKSIGWRQMWSGPRTARRSGREAARCGAGGTGRPASLLIVVSDQEAAMFKGAKNLAGVEIVRGELNTGTLAPGGAAGRLTVFTEAALKKVGEW